jgi:hypothetical protein
MFLDLVAVVAGNAGRFSTVPMADLIVREGDAPGRPSRVPVAGDRHEAIAFEHSAGGFQVQLALVLTAHAPLLRRPVQPLANPAYRVRA